MSSEPSKSAPPFFTLVAALRHRAEVTPDRRALIFLRDGESDDLTVTYADLDRRARAHAARLQEAGAAGERVLLLLPPGLEYVAAFFGCLYAGAVAVPVYPPRLGRAADRALPRLRAIVRDARPHAAITMTAGVAALAESSDFEGLTWIDVGAVEDAQAASWRAPAASAESLAFLQYTSGSTGWPKGVMVSHGNLLRNSALIQRAFGTSQNSVAVSWLPLYHDMGLIGYIIHPVVVGYPSVLMAPAEFLQKPYRWLQALSRYRGTISGGPDFAFDLCVRKVAPELRETLDLGSWSSAPNGAEPIRAETLERFAEYFAPCGFRRETFGPCYGLAEATLFVSGGPLGAPPVVLSLEKAALEEGRVVPCEGGAPGGRRLVGSGCTWPEAEIAIVDPKTRERCPEDRVGEIWVSGPGVAKGYWRHPEDTVDTFWAHIVGYPGRAYLRTGDLGFLCDGQLVITSRLKDLIIVDGRNHAPQDLELTAGQSHASLRPHGTAAFAVDLDGTGDDRTGERIVLVCEVERQQSGADAGDVAAAIRRAIAEEHELAVHAVVLIKPGALPRTSSGKVQRRACREAFLAGKLAVVGQPESRAQARDDEGRTAALRKRRRGGQSVLGGDRKTAPPANEASAEPQARAAAEIREWLIANLSRRLAVEPSAIDPQASFASHGLASRDAVALTGDLEDWLGRRLSPTLAYEYPTIDALCRHLDPAARAEVLPHLSLPASPTAAEPVAVIGLGCRFPKASDPRAFWRLLTEGGDAIVEVPCDRWNAGAFYDPDPDAPGKANTRWGGFLDGIAGFDATFFGISPREASRQDPQQRLLMEVAWEALEDAGTVPGALADSRTGVFVGISTNEYAHRQLADPRHIDAYVGTGNALSVAANRLSYHFGFRGPSLAVDTACSSSLVAVHLACQSLRSGECDLALAGGVNLILSPAVTINFTKAGVMAPDGRCKTFDASADGYVRGEGAGLVVLKPLSKAVADGDPIYAVIRGSAIGHDGRTNGLMAPSREAQEAVLAEAYAQAGAPPSSVQYVEAHGTGTSLGDAIEARALGAVVGQGRPPESPCRIGSVKTNIGHLEAAAGVAGLIKVALCLKHKKLPPSLHFTQANPHIPFADLGLEVQAALTSWPDTEQPALAGVSSFGFGGTNAHVVVEEPPSLGAPVTTEAAAPPWLLPISARSERALRSLAESYATWLAHTGAESLADVCFTAARRRSHHERRLAVAGRSPEALRLGLQAWLAGKPDPAVASGRAQGERKRIVFVFPGQGSQWLGMGRELLAREPAFRAALEDCDHAIRALAGFSPLGELTADPSRSRLDEIDVLQPTLFAVEVSLAALWRAWGIHPDAVVGHSMGEVAAAFVAGALTLEDATRVVVHRSRLMRRLAGHGAMAVAGLSLSDADSLVAAYEGRVSLAGSNSPSSAVLSGEPAAIEEIVEALRSRNVFCRKVSVDVAAHSHQMEPLRSELIEALEAVAPRAARVPFYSTVTASPHEGTDLTAEYWGRNLREPVRFAEAVSRVAGDGHQVYLEVSPHPVLLTPIQQTLSDLGASSTLVGSTERGESEAEALLRSLGTLHALGFPVDWPALSPNGGRCVPLPSYPWERQRHWFDPGESRALEARSVPEALSSAPLHPLLGRRLTLALPEAVYEWHTGDGPAFFLDHRVYGAAVVPTTAYLEMILAAGGQGGDRVVEDLSIEEPLFVGEAEARRVQVVVDPTREGRRRVRILSRADRADEASAWTVHASALLAAADPTEPGAEVVQLPPEAQRLSMAEEVSKSDHYATCEGCGIQYGPAFRGLVSIWRGSQGALGLVELPDHLRAESSFYGMHPALLDACFQVAEACLPVPGLRPEGSAFMPIGLTRYRLQGRLAERVWSHVQLRTTPSLQGETLVVDVCVMDEAGQVLATADGLCLKRARRESLLGRAASDDWFYETQWVPQPPAAPSTGAARPSRWLVLADEGGVGAALADRFRLAGETVVVVSQRDAGGQHLHEAAAEGALKDSGVVHLWSLDGDASAQRTSTSLLEVLDTVRALAAAPSQHSPRLWLVTRRGQAAAEGEASLDPFAAPLWGLGRVLALEQGSLWGGLVDLDDAPPDQAAATLFEHLVAGDGEDQVCFRDGKRSLARLGRRAAPPANAPGFRADGTYLITGGLGALGVRCARWMAARGARHLTLVGRSGLPERAVAAVREIESLGACVRIVAADVADEAQTRALLASLTLPLAGIFHLAGLSRPQPASEIGAVDMEAVLRPKVLGAWNLHTLTLETGADLQCFVLFSSAASVWGSQGLAHYAAANSFLDGLAHHRRGLGLPALAVNWARFSEAGMVSPAEESTLEAIGVGALPIDPALDAMWRLVGAGAAQRTVAAVDWAAFKPVYEAKRRRPLLDGLVSAKPATTLVPPEDGDGLLLGLERVSRRHRRQILIDRLRLVIAGVLGFPEDQLPESNRGFFEMGMDSIMAVQLKRRLEASLGRTLPTTVAFEHPTVESLAKYVDDAFLPAEPIPDATAPAVLEEQQSLMNDLEDLAEQELVALLAKEVEEMRGGPVG